MSEQISADLQKAMLSAVERTLSDMAFLDVIAKPDFPETLKFSSILHISVVEPIRGEIALFLSTECKKLIVENIYGSDWDSLHDVEIDDCLLEMLNVLAGNFLSEYCGESVKHDVSLPELRFDDSETFKGNMHHRLYFEAEETFFGISISFSEDQ